VTFKYHLVPNTHGSLLGPRRPLCGQQEPTEEDCNLWTKTIDTGLQRGFRDFVPPEGKRKFRAILLNDHYDGCHHVDTRNICEHCETIAASKKTLGGLYRCDGRLLG